MGCRRVGSSRATAGFDPPVPPGEAPRRRVEGPNWPLRALGVGPVRDPTPGANGAGAEAHLAPSSKEVPILQTFHR